MGGAFDFGHTSFIDVFVYSSVQIITSWVVIIKSACIIHCKCSHNSLVIEYARQRLCCHVQPWISNIHGATLASSNYTKQLLFIKPPFVNSKYSRNSQ